MKNNKYAHFFCVGILLLFCQNSIAEKSPNSFDVKNLPHPYCDLTEVLPFDNHGWYFNADWIQKLMHHNNIVNIVEIGSWLGASTRHMASLLPASGKLYAIDTWKGSIEHQAPLYASKLPTLYQQFLSNVVRSGFAEKIIPVRMTSLQAASYIKQYRDSFDLIYVDAAHDTASVLQDLELYFPFVQGNRGILCGDDWSWQTVRVAVIQFAQKYSLTIYAAQNFWFFVEGKGYQGFNFLTCSEDVWKVL